MMSTFQHNPYRQCAPPQPSVAAVDVCVARRSRPACPLRTTPSGSVLLRQDSQPPTISPSTEGSPISQTSPHTQQVNFNHSNSSFSASRDASATRGPKADGERVAPSHSATPSTTMSTTTTTTTTNTAVMGRCPFQHLHAQLQNSGGQPSHPGLPSVFPPSPDGTQPQPQQHPHSPHSPQQWGDASMANASNNSHNWNERNATTAAAQFHADPHIAQDGNANFNLTTPKSAARSSASTGATTMSSMSVDMLATTLFIDGLPPTIENPFQLTPYVPPQGLMKVRVKRSRGRDVGFAVYNSVDAASAALAWFHDIHMIKEVVQSSAFTSLPCSSDIGSAHHPLLEALLYYRDLEGGVAPSYEHPLPIAYEDFVEVSQNPAEYAKLLRSCISLRVEWAHTHEVYHLPQAVSKSYCPFLTGVITELPVSLQPWLQRNFRDTSTQEATIHESGGHVRSISDLQIHSSSISREDSSTFALSQVEQQMQQQQQQQRQQMPPPPQQQCPYRPLQMASNGGASAYPTAASGGAAPSTMSAPSSLPPPPPPPPHPQSAGCAPTPPGYYADPTAAAAAAAGFGGASEGTHTRVTSDLQSNSLSERPSNDPQRAVPPYSSNPTAGNLQDSFPTSPTLLSAVPSSEHSALTSNTPGHLRQSSWGKSGERRLPSRTLFVKLTHNFPVPPLNSVALHRMATSTDSASDFFRGGAEGPTSSFAGQTYPRAPQDDGSAENENNSNNNNNTASPAPMTAEDQAFFALAQQVLTEEFFSEQFAGFQRFRPFLHPPYYGGCFVLFERDADMHRCLQWMRGDARLMSLFSVQPARSDTFER